MGEPRRRREREAAWGASSVKPLFHPGLVKPSVVPLREVRYLEPETPLPILSQIGFFNAFLA